MIPPVRPLLLTLATVSLLAGCGGLEPNRPADQERNASRDRALARQRQAACSSQATYDRLKQVAFDDAIRIRNADPKNLDILATHSVVRMENPVVKSRDETLDVTVCSGTFVLELPPGAERAFGGERRLKAEIEYAAQAAADGSGLVYRIKGAEPIVYKLAAFDLKGSSVRKAATDQPSQVAVAPRPAPSEAVADPYLERPVPTAQPRPIPAPAPTRSVEAPRSSPRASSPPVRTVANPSFNCRLARSRSERMVCASPRLASLDRSMSSLFYSELSNADAAARAELRRSRDRFLAYRDRCTSESCVAEAYRDRMDEIEDIASGR
ncbi:MAG: hypothetical protein ABW194_07100 [Novosphingobium sp.]